MVISSIAHWRDRTPFKRAARTPAGMYLRARVENDQDPGRGAGLHLADHQLPALRRLGPVNVAESIAATVPPDPERIAPIAGAVPV